MNTKYIFAILFLTIAQFAFAQKEPLLHYEWFEEQSKIISDMQVKTNGKQVTINNGETLTLSFVEENFKVFYNDQLASYSGYLGKNLILAENVDLSKAIGMYQDGDVCFVIFPNESLNVQIYSDNNSSFKGFSLDFHSINTDNTKMFTTLYNLISLLKESKGLISSSDKEQHWQEYNKMKPYEFYKKYPKSILAYQGKLLERNYERQIKFANEFIARFPIPSLRIENPNYSRTFEMSFKNKIKKKENFISNVGVQGEPLDPTVNSVRYTIIVSKDYNLVKQKYDEIVIELTKNFDDGFIESGDSISFLEATHVFLNTRTGVIGKNIPFERIINNIKSINIYLDKEVHRNEVWYELCIFFS